METRKEIVIVARYSAQYEPFGLDQVNARRQRHEALTRKVTGAPAQRSPTRNPEPTRPLDRKVRRQAGEEE